MSVFTSARVLRCVCASVFSIYVSCKWRHVVRVLFTLDAAFTHPTMRYSQQGDSVDWQSFKDKIESLNICAYLYIRVFCAAYFENGKVILVFSILIVFLC